MKAEHTRDQHMRLYNAMYFLSLGLLVFANFAFLLQLRRQYNFDADFSMWQVGIAGALAAGWFLLAHQKRLVLLRSDPVGYGVYHFLLWLALMQLCLGILSDPWHLSGISQGWQEALGRLESDPASQRLQEISILELLRGGVSLLYNIAKSIFFALFGVLLRIALTLLCIAALLTGLVTLVVMWSTDIKSGVLIVLLLLLFGGGGWFLQVTDSEVNYGPTGVLALLGSVLLSVNWGSLYINANIENFHPRFYRLITQFNHQEGTLTRDDVREQIGAMLGTEAGEHTPQVIDAIETRLVTEQLLVPQAGQQYKPGFQKRLRTWHVLIGGVVLLYIFNPGFGMLEIIPDNLPIIGNLDEVLLGGGVFAWLYGLYLEDRREMRRDKEPPAPFPALAPVAPASVPVQSALQPPPERPLLDTEFQRRPND